MVLADESNQSHRLALKQLVYFPFSETRMVPINMEWTHSDESGFSERPIIFREYFCREVLGTSVSEQAFLVRVVSSCKAPHIRGTM